MKLHVKLELSVAKLAKYFICISVSVHENDNLAFLGWFNYYVFPCFHVFEAVCHVRLEIPVLCVKTKLLILI